MGGGVFVTTVLILTFLSDGRVLSWNTISSSSLLSSPPPRTRTRLPSWFKLRSLFSEPKRILSFNKISNFLIAADVLWVGRNVFPLLACFYRSSEATWGWGNQHAVTDRCTSKTFCPWHQSPQSWHCHLKSGQQIFVDWLLPPAGIVAPRGPFRRKRRIMT